MSDCSDRQMSIHFCDRTYVRVQSLSLFRSCASLSISICLATVLFLSGTAASHAAVSIKTGADLKKVALLKQSGPADGMLGENTAGTFYVEVITDALGLRDGLSHRESMPEHHGMLFVLDSSKEHVFWMKGMIFPLDIIFIGKDMRITEILENLQPCEECPVYFPKVPPAFALEINAGLSRRYGIEKGDTLVIDR